MNALGVVPLIIAQGARVPPRPSMGLVIFSGFLIVTCFKLFIVPMFCSPISPKQLTPEAEKPSAEAGTCHGATCNLLEV